MARISKKKVDNCWADNPPAATVKPVTATIKPPTANGWTYPLSKEAILILTEAAKDNDGIILYGDESGGYYIQVNGRDVVQPKDGRAVAKFRTALAQLANENLISRWGDTTFRVHDLGYKYCDGSQASRAVTRGKAKLKR